LSLTVWYNGDERSAMMRDEVIMPKKKPPEKMPFWWFRKRTPLPKIVWKHDGWTLNRIYERVCHHERRKRIMDFLMKLRADISCTKIMKETGEKRANIVRWIKDYNKNGLQVLLAISVAVPVHFRNRIERYIKQHPNVINQLLLLITDDDFEMYGEEMEVEGYALKSWVYELELGGTDARQALLRN
jgi:hypothetical protein